jgi:Protein of unknown function (DUF3078)
MKQRIKYILAFLLLISSFSKSQDDTSKALWAPSAAAGINLSQIALSNWTQGGDNSITWTLIANGGIQYLAPDWSFRNSIKFDYGRTKLGSQGFRTNDNDLYIDAALSKNVGWAVNPFFSISLRTAVTTGYNL